MRHHGCGGLPRTLRWVFWICQLVCSVALAQDVQPPTTPTNFTAVASSSTTIVLNWSASTDNVAVTGYQLERCQGSGCNSAFSQINLSSPGWANSGRTPSTTYGYRLRALDAVPNYSAFTSIVYVTTQAAADTQAPTTPTNFAASASSSTTVVLNWSASTDNVGVTGYQLERCQGSGCNSSFAQINLSSPGWANSGLTPSTTYGYRLRALDAVPNYSLFTSIVYVTTQAGAGDTLAPTTPANLTASASSSTTVVLNWSASTDNVAVTGYQLERCQGSGCNSSFAQINLSSPGWANSGLAPSTTYGYRLRALDAVPNYSAFTSIVYVTTQAGAGDTLAPTMPTGFTAVASSSTTIIVNWSASTDNVAVTGYQVERCLGSGCNSSFAQLNLSSPGWANSGLTPSTTYGYRVRALDAVPNYSAFTAIVYVTTQAAAGDTQPPTVPGNFSVVANSSTQISAGWSASIDNVAVAGYQLERCQGSGCNSSFTQFNIASPAHTDTGRTASTTYGYRVRARDAVPNYSAFTSIVYVTTPAAGDIQAPTTPAGLTVTAASNQLTLAWIASIDNVGVTAYLVERCEGACTYAQIASVSATSYTDASVVVGTNYSYRVRARDAVPNYSQYSSAVSGSTAAQATIGNVVTYEYDDAMRLRRANHPDAKQISYTLDAAGNRTQVQNALPPDVPSSITVPATSATGSYAINWVASTQPVTSYQLFEATNSSFNGQLQVNSSGTSAAISGKADGTYYYRVRACYTTVCSDYRAGGNSIVVGNPPGVPASIDVPASSYTGLYTLNWGVASGTVTAYELYESTNPSFSSPTQLYRGLLRTLNVPLRGSGTYYYRVRACNDITCGEYRTGSNPTIVTLPSITLDDVSIGGGGSISAGGINGFIGFSYTLTAQGDISIFINGNNVSQQGPARTSWLAPKANMSSYQARATTTCSQYMTGTYGAWFTIGSGTVWGVSIPEADRTAYCSISVQIRAAADPSVILDDATINVGLYSEQ